MAHLHVTRTLPRHPHRRDGSGSPQRINDYVYAVGGGSAKRRFHVIIAAELNNRIRVYPCQACIGSRCRDHSRSSQLLGDLHSYTPDRASRTQDKDCLARRESGAPVQRQPCPHAAVAERRRHSTVNAGSDFEDRFLCYECPLRH